MIKNMQPVLFISILFSSSLWAASFDCVHAISPDEKTICSVRSLNDLDVEMNVKYHFLKGLLPMGGQGDMRDAQRLWLKKRQACGNDADCLAKQYHLRIAQFDRRYAAINKPL